MTPDRHNAIQNLNYYLRPDPPLFLLPSTFKELQKLEISDMLVLKELGKSSFKKSLGVFKRTFLEHRWAVLLVS